MIALLALVAVQAFAFPPFSEGTEVRLVSPDLLTVHATGRVEAGALRLEGDLQAGAELRLLVFAPDAPSEAPDDSGEAGAWRVRVGPQANDLLLRHVEQPPDAAISLRTFLREERGLELRLIPTER